MLSHNAFGKTNQRNELLQAHKDYIREGWELTRLLRRELSCAILMQMPWVGSNVTRLFCTRSFDPSTGCNGRSSGWSESSEQSYHIYLYHNTLITYMQCPLKGKIQWQSNAHSKVLYCAKMWKFHISYLPACTHTHLMPSCSPPSVWSHPPPPAEGWRLHCVEMAVRMAQGFQGDCTMDTGGIGFMSYRPIVLTASPYTSIAHISPVGCHLGGQH